MVGNLRLRYNLPESSTNVHKKSFVVPSLYGFRTFTGCGFNTLFPPLDVLFQFGFSVFMCYIASHCDVMSLSVLCEFVTLNKNITYLLTYLLT